MKPVDPFLRSLKISEIRFLDQVTGILEKELGVCQELTQAYDDLREEVIRRRRGGKIKHFSSDPKNELVEKWRKKKLKEVRSKHKDP